MDESQYEYRLTIKGQPVWLTPSRREDVSTKIKQSFFEKLIRLIEFKMAADLSKWSILFNATSDLSLYIVLLYITVSVTAICLNNFCTTNYDICS